MAPVRVWNDSEKLTLLKTVLLTLGKPKIRGELVAEQWVGTNPPSARQIRDNYNAILRVAEAEAVVNSTQPVQKTERIKDDNDDNEDKKSIMTPIPKGKATIMTPALARNKNRLDYTTPSIKAKKGRKRKRSDDSESEDPTMSSEGEEDICTPTPSKRILPSRNARNGRRARYVNGGSDDDEDVDDAAKDFGGVGSDAEYENVAE